MEHQLLPISQHVLPSTFQINASYTFCAHYWQIDPSLFFHQCFQHMIAQATFPILQFLKEWSISICIIIIANGSFYLVLFCFNGIMCSQISKVTFKVKTYYVIHVCFRYLKILICNQWYYQRLRFLTTQASYDTINLKQFSLITRKIFQRQ